MSAWGVPDWRDASAYPSPDASRERWRWEFTRRRHDYRKAWQNGRERELTRRHWRRLRALARAQKDYQGFVDRERVAREMRGLEHLEEQGKMPGLSWFDEDLQATVCDPTHATPNVLFMTDRAAHVDLAANRENQLPILFHLDQPLKPQLEKAQQLFEAYRRWAKLEDKDRGREHRAKWPTYLRVLDARDDGASWAQIARAVLPATNADHSPQTARRWWEQARALMFKVGA